MGSGIRISKSHEVCQSEHQGVSCLQEVAVAIKEAAFQVLVDSQKVLVQRIRLVLRS